MPYPLCKWAWCVLWKCAKHCEYCQIDGNAVREVRAQVDIRAYSHCWPGPFIRHSRNHPLSDYTNVLKITKVNVRVVRISPINANTHLWESSNMPWRKLNRPIFPWHRAYVRQNIYYGAIAWNRFVCTCAIRDTVCNCVDLIDSRQLNMSFVLCLTSLRWCSAWGGVKWTMTVRRMNSQIRFWYECHRDDN